MSTINTPFKSGTITSVNGDQVTVSTPLELSDVGRLLVITSGNANRLHRLITAVSGNIATVNLAFNVSPFTGFTDSNPIANDSFVLSYNLRELAATDADITLTDSNNISIAAMQLIGDAFVYGVDLHVTLKSDDIRIADTGGLIFGYWKAVPTQDAYTVNSCNITDTVVGLGGDQMANGAEDFGMLDIYGGNVNIVSNCFWRCYDNNNQHAQTRWFDVEFKGSFGSRVEGARSIVKVRAVNASSTLGITNPRATVTRVELSAFNCDQAVYAYLPSAPNGYILLSNLQDIKQKVLRVAGASGSISGRVDVEAKVNQINAAPALAVVEGGSANNHILRVGNKIQATYLNASLQKVTDQLSFLISDNQDEIKASETLVTGVSNIKFYRYADITSLAGTRRISDGTTYAPYKIIAHAYAWKPSILQVSLKTKETPSITLFPDTYITASEAVANSYADIADLNQLYDAVKLAKKNNPLLPTQQTSFFNVSGSTLALDSEWRIVRSQSQGSAIALDVANKIINVKFSQSGLAQSDKFTGLSGQVDSSFDGFATIDYVRSDGNVNVAITDLNPAGFTLSAQAPANVIYKPTSSSSWTTISSHNSNQLLFAAAPSTDYDVRVRVPGYDWKQFQVNSGDFGNAASANVNAHKTAQGEYLYELAITTAQMNAITLSGNKLQLANTSGVELLIEFGSAYRKYQNLVHNPALISDIEPLLLPNALGNGFVIPDINTKLVLSSSSNANVFLGFELTHQSTGMAARDRLVANSSGQSVQMPTAVNIVSVAVPAPSAEQNAQAVWEAEQRSLTTSAALTPTESNQLTQIKLRVDNLPQG